MTEGVDPAPYAWTVPDGELADVCPFVMAADDKSAGYWDKLESIAAARCSGGMFESIDLSTLVDPALAPDASQLQQFFLQIAHHTLQGDKLELAATGAGRLPLDPENRTVSGSFDFVVGHQDPTFNVLLSWEEGFFWMESMVLVKDDVRYPIYSHDTAYHDPRIEQSVQVVRGDRHVSVTARPPVYLSQQGGVAFPGEWELRWTARSGYYEVVTPDTFTYNVFVTSDNTVLATEFDAFQPTEGVGEPMVVEARVTEAGAPVTGLGEAITVRVSGPDLGLGNVLTASDAAPADSPEQDDPLTLAARKAAAMLASDERTELLAAMGFDNTFELPLVHIGDGIYRVEFTPVVEGGYQFHFELDGTTPRNGRITRAYALSRRVRVVPAAAATPIVTAQLADDCSAGDSAPTAGSEMAAFVRQSFPGGCFRADLTPRDAQGNYVGPGKAESFRLGISDASPGATVFVLDNLDGSYTVYLGYEEEPRSDPVLSLNGTPLRIDIVEGDDDPGDDPGEFCIGNCCCDPTARGCRAGGGARGLTLALGAALLALLAFVARRRVRKQRQGPAQE